jgi:hypothetical protein
MKWVRLHQAIGCGSAHGWAVVCLGHLLEELRLKPAVVPKALKALVDVRAHVEHEQTTVINLLTR